MLNTVIGALLPLIVTLAFGFLAAWHRDFNSDQAAVLNRMVLLYALPLVLFAGTVATKRGALTRDVGLIAAIAGAMLIPQAVTILIAHYLYKRDLGFSALAGLAVGGPSVAFAGSVVLGYLFGKASVVPVAVGALVLNVIQVPVTLILLEIASAPNNAPPAPVPSRTHEAPVRAPARRAATADGASSVRAGASAGPGSVALAAVSRRTEPAAPRRAVGSQTGDHARANGGSAANRLRLGDQVLAVVKEPVVWAPVAALVIVLLGVSIPASVDHALKLLGTASTGVALFATGIVLYAQHVALSRSVIAIVAARNVMVPAGLWAALAALGASHTMLRQAVLTLAIPTAVAVAIFAVHYKHAEREMASVVFLSTVLSFFTVAAFITAT